jgi:CRISPR system Cascade subunit CasE
MFFTLIRLGRNASPRDVALLSKKDGYQSHCLIWNLFADRPDRRRDFLYRHETANGWPTFYTVSDREPRDDTGLWEIYSKLYTPKLVVGQQLAFTLRANPIRTKRDEQGRQHRHDVIMDGKAHLKQQNGTAKNSYIQEILRREGVAWLDSRAGKYGFSFGQQHLRVEAYQQHSFYGKGGKISFSTLDFSGILTVVDIETFIAALYQGIGPAKGFGCGLMMVRRL